MTSPYHAHLALGLDTYEQRTGRRPSDEALDIARPAVRALYDRFRRRRGPRLLGPNEGELAQLRLGLKQVLRERLRAEHVPSLQARCEADGMAVLLVPLPSPPGAHGIDGLDTAPLSDVHAYVGPHRDALAEAAELDGKMLPHQLIGPDHPVVQGPSVADSKRLGELLGYPACCREWFAGFASASGNREPVRAAAAATRRFEAKLNNLSLGFFHFIAWSPCRYDCPASLRLAERIEAAVSKTHPLGLQEARRLLAYPRLYLGDRRQLIFAGHAQDDTIHYDDVFTPYGLDRMAGSAAFEWVFFADLVPTLLRGDALRRHGERWLLLRRGEVLEELHFPGATVLPFGGSLRPPPRAPAAV